MSVLEDGRTPANSNVILEIDAFPFKALKISEDWKKLEAVENRTLCSKCNKSRKYFCYTCYVAVPEVVEIVPKVKLPIKVDIIKHAREMDGKSTAVHAAVLAPEDVTIYTYPCIPDYSAKENVVLVFPNPDAVSVDEVCRKFHKEVCDEPESKRQCLEHKCNKFVIHRVVFIDSTWNQSRGIFKDSRVRSLPSVLLRSRLSQFWRHQADSPRWYLATIEAVHQFFLEVDRAQWTLNRGNCGTDQSSDDASANERPEKQAVPSTSSTEVLDSRLPQIHEEANSKEGVSSHEEYCYNGQYDNLLFFFRFMYSKIHTLYEHENLRSYKRRLE